METTGASEAVRRNVRKLCRSDDYPELRTSQADLARRLGWSRQRLSKMLSTDRPISVDELTAIAMALGVAPVALLTPAEPDDELEVRVSDRESWVLDRADALGWLAGLPTSARLDMMMRSPERYFAVLPTRPHRWYGRKWFELVEHTQRATLADSIGDDMPGPEER